MAAPVQVEEQSYTIPKHPGPWTLEEWRALPAGMPTVGR